MSGQGDNIPPEVINKIDDNAVQNMRQDVGNVDFKDLQQALSNDNAMSGVTLPDLALGKASSAGQPTEADLQQGKALQAQTERPEMAQAWQNHDKEFADAMKAGDKPRAMASLDSTSQMTARHIAGLENQVGVVVAAMSKAELGQRNQKLSEQIV